MQSEELAAQLQLGRDLALASEDVELHGSVVNEGGARVMAGFALAGSALALLALRYPLRAEILLMAVLAAGAWDLFGGRSWLRRFVPREVGRTVLTWRPAARVTADPLPPRRLLLILPTDALRIRDLRPLSAIPVGLGLGAAAVGALLEAAGAGFATSLLLAASLILALLGAVGLFFDRIVPPAVDPASGGRLARRLLDALADQPLKHTDVVIAVVGGGCLFHDGVEVLLKNHINRLAPASTRVLSGSPAGAPLHGARRWSPAHPPRRRRAAGCRQRLGPGQRPGRHGGGPGAGRLGWAGLGLTGGMEDPGSIVRSLHQLLTHLDQLEAERP